MYLQYFLQQEEESLLKNFFKAQMENPVKSDWTMQVLKDLEEDEFWFKSLFHFSFKFMPENTKSVFWKDTNLYYHNFYL